MMDCYLQFAPWRSIILIKIKIRPIIIFSNYRKDDICIYDSHNGIKTFLTEILEFYLNFITLQIWKNIHEKMIERWAALYCDMEKC